MKRFLVKLLFATWILASGAHALSGFTHLRAAYEQGQISYEQYLVNSALQIFDPEKVPSIHQIPSDQLPLKTGTFVIQEIKANWDRLSPQSQAMLTPYFQRPALPLSIRSASGQFRIHYTRDGSNRVDGTDRDSNGIPDFVEAAAEYFDHTHHVIVDRLGYQSPPADSGGKGTAFDIYLISLHNTYGITWLEESVPGKKDAYSCYIEVDNDFLGFKTPALGALQVTSAHEYFHAVQVGYRYRDEDVFFMEMCSTWMEDYIYDEVNDYLFYLDNFFNAINYPFYYTNGSWFEYGSCLWNHMIVKKYGPEVIREIWQAIPQQTAFSAIQQVLPKYGTTFNQELASFGIWNYFTGSRADTIKYYPDGHLYPEIKIFGKYTLQGNSLVLTEQMRKLSSTYFQLIDIYGGTTIGLVITNFQTPDANYLTSDRASFNLHVTSIATERGEDSEFLFLINNLIRLNDHVGVRLGEDPNATNQWQAQAIVMDDRGGAEIIQFFPATFQKMYHNYIYKIFPNPFIIGLHDSVKVYNVIAEPNVPTSIQVFSADGRLIRSNQFDQSQYRYSWNGRNSDGELVSSGVYVIVLRAGGMTDMKKLAVVRKR
ncbi:MAG: T9SS type A sorting domain-containing protein [candidate division KSB1 bacterium]|nr:T9SS type A sorting domain-containing protein [candidate division KSB1 bacterium]MDZ7356021.1 T9SS type A sorting domain-containing protein [candidate division KSB1 bacterium]